MRIITPGIVDNIPRTETCDHCGCVFSFTLREAYRGLPIPQLPNVIRWSIKCPQKGCDHNVGFQRREDDK